ncbi:hypothetical protein D3C85_1389800 [compost metagenome]
MGVGHAQAIGRTQAPVQLRFSAAEACFIAVAGDVLVVAQWFADHAGDFVVEQLEVNAYVGVGEVTVIAQFPRTHPLLFQVTWPTGLDEVLGAALAERARGQVVDPIAPIDVVLEHVW